MRIKYKEALRMLKENGFEQLHKKGSHIKFGKGELRFIITEGGWKGSGELHSKQTKELLDIINNKETEKTKECHGTKTEVK